MSKEILARAALAISVSSDNLDCLFRLDNEFKAVNIQIASKQEEQNEITEALTLTQEALDAEKKLGLSGKGLYSIIGELRAAYKAVEGELATIYKHKMNVTQELIILKRDGVATPAPVVKQFNTVRIVKAKSETKVAA